MLLVNKHTQHCKIHTLAIGKTASVKQEIQTKKSSVRHDSPYLLTQSNTDVYVYAQLRTHTSLSSCKQQIDASGFTDSQTTNRTSFSWYHKFIPYPEFDTFNNRINRSLLLKKSMQCTHIFTLGFLETVSGFTIFIILKHCSSHPPSS